MRNHTKSLICCCAFLEKLTFLCLEITHSCWRKGLYTLTRTRIHCARECECFQNLYGKHRRNYFWQRYRLGVWSLLGKGMSSNCPGQKFKQHENSKNYVKIISCGENCNYNDSNRRRKFLEQITRTQKVILWNLTDCSNVACKKKNEQVLLFVPGHMFWWGMASNSENVQKLKEVHVRELDLIQALLEEKNVELKNKGKEFEECTGHRDCIKARVKFWRVSNATAEWVSSANI